MDLKIKTSAIVLGTFIAVLLIAGIALPAYVVKVLSVIVFALFGITLLLAWNKYRKLYKRLIVVSKDIRNGNSRPQIQDKINHKWFPLKDPVFELLDAIHRSANLINSYINDELKDTPQLPDAGKPLAGVLNNLRNKLINLTEEKERRNWHANGLNEFGELLRENTEDIKQLCQGFLSKLVKHLGCNQGGFFMLEDQEGDPFLRLMACYAYKRKRIFEDQNHYDAGLLQQCIHEKDIIYLTDVPDDYVNITSGLGEATPKNLVIVPLVYEEEVFGVLEIASFDKMQDYHIEFLKGLSKMTASTLKSVKGNLDTKKLLEDHQDLNQQLKNHEEELRQNLENLEITQREMEVKQAELDGLFNSINNASVTIEFDLEGKVFMANDNLLHLLEYPKKEVESLLHEQLLAPQFVSDFDIQSFWQAMQNGEYQNCEHLFKSKKGKEIWVQATYTPIKNESGAISKVLMIGHDITEKKLAEEEFKKLSLVANHTNNAVIITDKEGLVEYVNDGFTRMTGYALQEVKGRKPGHILQGKDTDQGTVEHIRKHLIERKPFKGEILNYKKSGQSYWISISINPIIDDKGNLEKYVAVESEITDIKEKSLDFNYKLEAISRVNATVEFDIDGKIQLVNENLSTILGFGMEELIGVHHDKLLLSSHQNTEYKSVIDIVKEEEYVSGEYIYLTKDMRKVWLKANFNLIENLKGEPLKIVMYAQDITHEKALEEANKKQQAELQSHLDAINKTIATVEFDMDGNIQWANEIYLGITGYKPNELVDKNIEVLLSEDEKSKPQHNLMWSNLKEGKFFSGEYKHIDKNGKELWLNGTFNPIFNHAGEPYKVMMFAQFTTDDKERQIELSGKINAINNSTLVMELKNDGAIKSANAQFLDFTGISRLQLRNKSFSDFLTDDSRFDFDKLLEKMNEGKFEEVVLTFRSKNDEEVKFRTTFTPVKNLEDKLGKIVVIMFEERKVVLDKIK